MGAEGGRPGAQALRGRAAPPARAPPRESSELERARRGTDVPRLRAEELAGSLLLEDVRRPTRDTGAGEHRRCQRRRDVGDVEHESRVELDVRLERPLGMAALQLGERNLLEPLRNLDLW